MSVSACHSNNCASPAGTDEQQPLLRSDGQSEDAIANTNANTAHENSSEHQRQHFTSPEPGFTIKLVATTINFLISGLVTAAIGVLLPDIENHYGLTDARVAFIFPAGVFGYLIATATAQWIQLRGGRRAIAIIAPISRILATATVSQRPTFAVVLASYAVIGYGTGITDTAWNDWAGGMRRANVVQGILHGSFAVGCIVGPIMSMTVKQSHHWATFYGVLSLLSCLELFAQSWAFRQDGRACDQLEDSTFEAGKLQNPLRQRSVWIMGIFYFFYQCVEASYTDWIALYLARRPHVTPEAAASAPSAFWIGMALGRYCLGLLTERFGIRWAVVMYSAATILLQLCASFVSQLAMTLVLIGACGFFLGPLFPSGIILISSLFSGHGRGQVVALMIAMGQIGAAIAPLAVGVLSTKLGIQYLMQLTLGFSVAMLAIWTAAVQSQG